jgi:hypothetical protein
MNTLKLVGSYPGTALDSGLLWGIGMAENPAATFLFAAYSTSGTIATYAQGPDCTLTLKSEIIAIGANVGSVDGMKVTPNGKYLIVAYGDGSIGSYAIHPTTGALTLIGRYLVTDSGLATGVDITADSKWAVLGTVSFLTGGEVEVAPFMRMVPSAPLSAIYPLAEAVTAIMPGGARMRPTSTSATIPPDKSRLCHSMRQWV